MKKPKLLKQLRREIRRRNYSYRTEGVYVRWIVRFIRFYGMVGPSPQTYRHGRQRLAQLAR